MAVLGFVKIGAKPKSASLPDGFIENPIIAATKIKEKSLSLGVNEPLALFHTERKRNNQRNQKYFKHQRKFWLSHGVNGSLHCNSINYVSGAAE